MINKEFATKKDFKMIQGVAVALMAFHHLFGFPERIDVPYIAPFDFEFIHIETILAYFGRICVSMFSFCSGYGLYQKNAKIDQEERWTLSRGYKECFHIVKRFYSRYWIVFLTFVPFGFYKHIYEFSALQFIKNVLGVACTYNGEWWYAYTYIRLVIIFPLLYSLARIMINKGQKKRLFLVSIMVVGFLYCVSIGTDKEREFLTCLLTFCVGMLVASFNIFEAVSCYIENTGRFSYGIVSAVLIFFVGIRAFITLKADFLIAPVIIWCLVYWLHSKYVLRPIKRLLAVLGKYSQYIWLTHSFFAYYYFQKQLYALSISWIIFAACLGICVSIGAILETILHITEKTMIRIKNVRICE